MLFVPYSAGKTSYLLMVLDVCWNTSPFHYLGFLRFSLLIVNVSPEIKNSFFAILPSSICISIKLFYFTLSPTILFKVWFRPLFLLLPFLI